MVVCTKKQSVDIFYATEVLILDDRLIYFVICSRVVCLFGFPTVRGI